LKVGRNGFLTLNAVVAARAEAGNQATTKTSIRVLPARVR
jgi:hypothetical protein